MYTYFWSRLVDLVMLHITGLGDGVSMNTYISSIVKELVTYMYIYFGSSFVGLVTFTFFWSRIMELVMYTYLSSMLKDLVMYAYFLSLLMQLGMYIYISGLVGRG